MKKILAVLLIFTIIIPNTSLALGNDYEYEIAPQYDGASSFTGEGIAIVWDKSGKSAVINTAGEIVIEFNDKPMCIRKNGLIMMVGDNDFAAFFSPAGEQLTDYIYDTYKTYTPISPQDAIYPYVTNIFDGEPANGLIPISRDKKFGYINAEGIEVIPPTYDYAEGFYHNDIARVQSGGKLSEIGTYTEGKYGYIKYSKYDEPNFQTLYPADSLWYADEFKGRYVNIDDGQFKTLDYSMQEVNYDWTCHKYVEDKTGLILVKNNANQTAVYFDGTGKLIVPFSYSKKELVNGHVIEDEHRLIDRDGNVVPTPSDCKVMNPLKAMAEEYQSKYPEPELFVISKRVADYTDNYGLINYKGEVILEPVFDTIPLQMNYGMIYAEKSNGENAIYNKYGRKLFVLNGESGHYTNISCNLMPVKDSTAGKWGYIGYPFKKDGKAAADFLYNLDLFKGTGTSADGNPEYELSRYGTRIEGIVMLIRLLGKESEAVNHPKTHPFNDVPQWADGYISYAYDNGITTGISDVKFGNYDLTVGADYITFILRALGYSDKDGDFVWDDPYIFAARLGIQNRKGYTFKRAQMADIAYHALYAKLKNTDKYLWQILEDNGAIEKGKVPAEKSPVYTYEDAIDNIRHYETIDEIIELDTSSVIKTYIGGLPHGGIAHHIYIIYKSNSVYGEGATLSRLPVIAEDGSYAHTDYASELKASDDGETLIYKYNDDYYILNPETYELTILISVGDIEHVAFKLNINELLSR